MMVIPSIDKPGHVVEVPRDTMWLQRRRRTRDDPGKVGESIDQFLFGRLFQYSKIDGVRRNVRV